MNTDNHTTLPRRRYERRMVLLLSLSFGLVGLDRFIILPLFPVIMHDLQLDYQDLGFLSAALAFTWGFSALGAGYVIDRLGRKTALVLSIAVLSLLSGLSALASGLFGLVLLRALMGLCEGAFTPTSIIVTDEVSHPDRRGQNLGFQQALFPILGLCLGPLLAASLLELFDSWRTVFAIISLPGLLLAAYLWKVYRPAPLADRQRQARGNLRTNWLAAFRSGNVSLNILIMFCILTCQFVLCAMLPSYLTDYLHLETLSMAVVISAIGVGGFIGQLIIPAMSDRLGRKPVVMVSFMTSATLVGLLIICPAITSLLFLLLFLLSFFNFSLICMTVGPLTSESVPAALLPTATGIVVGFGEILGGGVSPAVAGYAATHFGLPSILYVALAGSVAGLLLSLCLRDSLAQRAPEPALQPMEALPASLTLKE
ncbi:MFS transporter [Pseudomonas gingeri]|uniref:MFS transporter n=1 Tax=Pseudomonas gingeri TaxID=117681 RepID=A0A7Y7YEN0_9PSED|nr:MFS transporter [Pseudomonas gingeri]NWB28169.1 MFS transporter [Pseudomonas gingeri]NWC34903.1 MFS transporter [Pseudomonas gingeri]NWD05339.1 MFS transporter [Pseudomonas gingeri]NWD47719.1 MFS transporter [Pseudomonas gingeri]NWE30454.1 MFS transporter [Pseudomonas gingeri]